VLFFFFFQAEDGIRDRNVTGVQTCALPIFECLKLGAYDYLIKPVDLDELQLSLQHALRQRQLEVDRRQLEQWLAREVAVRTRDRSEERRVGKEGRAGAARSARDWSGTDAALSRLAEEL